MSESVFAATRLKILGYVVSGEGLSPDQAKVDSVIICFPVPESVKDVLSFIGLCSYYRRCIKDFASIAEPLTNFTKKGQPFVWTDAQEKSFQTLKTALTSPPVLVHPNYKLPMELHYDACDYGIGVVLVNGEEQVLAYVSLLLSSAEKNYSITEKECLAGLGSTETQDLFVG